MEKFRNKLSKKKGFTLAELLVVVAIIGILVAVAIPVFNAATTRAENAVLIANGRSCKADAAVQYMAKGETEAKTYYYVVDKKGNIDKSVSAGGSVEADKTGYIVNIVPSGSDDIIDDAAITVSYIEGPGTLPVAGGSGTELPNLE